MNEVLEAAMRLMFISFFMGLGAGFAFYLMKFLFATVLKKKVDK